MNGPDPASNYSWGHNLGVIWTYFLLPVGGTLLAAFVVFVLIPWAVGKFARWWKVNTPAYRYEHPWRKH
jgi:TRAP-type C4-dicarboxylate transport system permease small subunit